MPKQRYSFRKSSLFFLVLFFVFSEVTYSAAVNVRASSVPFFEAMAGIGTADSNVTKSLLRRSASGSPEPVKSQARLKLLEVLYGEKDYAAVSALSGIFLKDSLERAGTELVVARSYYALKEYGKLVSLAQGWDYGEDRDLFLTVLLAEIEQNSPGWRSSLGRYLLTFPVRKKGESGFVVLEVKLKEKGLYSSLKERVKSLLLFKADTERRKYRRAVSEAAGYLSAADGNFISVSVIDEIVRVSLKGYGSGVILKAIEKIIDSGRLNGFSGNTAAYLYWGAGYLSGKKGFGERASRYYLEGMSLADGATGDKLLWYWFAGRVRRSSGSALGSIDFLVSKWENPAYFNDILSDLTDILVRRGDWKAVLLLSERLKDEADGDIVSRLSYLSARAVEENYVDASGESAEEWFMLSAGTGEGLGSGLYYKIMSMAESGYGNPEDFFDRIFTPAGEYQDEKEGIYDELLYGAADFGLAEYGKELLEKYPGRFSLPAVRYFASYLNGIGDYISSIRLLNRSLSDRGYVADKSDVSLLYPDAYRKEIEDVCSKKNLPEPVFFALIREESHFSSTIVSPAGAVGLSQLMPATAADVASRMRLRADDLTDPAVNLKLGGWYFGNLISRTDTVMQALFAYNGGLTRVRRWKKNYQNLPEDLFLEAVPYGETNLYGRKVLVSAVIYGYLYYNYGPEEIIRLVFSDNND